MLLETKRAQLSGRAGASALPENVPAGERIGECDGEKGVGEVCFIGLLHQNVAYTVASESRFARSGGATRQGSDGR